MRIRNLNCNARVAVGAWHQLLPICFGFCGTGRYYRHVQLTTLDWVIVVVSIVLSFAPAIYLMRRAGSSTTEFFTSGRAAPWWLIGGSMVATTFSTDTPNLVTNLVREHGVANNWVWWAFLLTGMSTVFFYARMWRRSGVLTDLEFYEIRYSGTAGRDRCAAFRAVYLGLFFNIVIMATVNLAAAKIANVLLGWPMWQTLAVCAVINVAFASIAGLWGVLVTDVFQFVIAMTASVAAAYFALQQPQVGGLVGTDRADPAVDAAPAARLQRLDADAVGADPAADRSRGGRCGIRARSRAAAATSRSASWPRRARRDALGGTLFFNVAHYALRPWPWIIVALSSMLVFPAARPTSRARSRTSIQRMIGHDMAYPAMLDVPARGLPRPDGGRACWPRTSRPSPRTSTGARRTSCTISIAASSATDADERHYVWMGRLVTALLMLLAAGMTFLLESARTSFELLLSIGAGSGLLYLLRWYWWRINAWSEIAAMAVSFVVAVGFFVAGKMGVAVDAKHRRCW